jgi:methionyl-tRNA formyltransferase
LDTGDVLLERPLPIGPHDTTGTLTEKLAALGADALIDVLERLPALPAKPQDAALATYAAKIAKPEARIDWSRPAVEIERQVRAFDPAPGAEAELGGLRIKVWESRVLPGMGLTPGSMAADDPSRLVVGTGEGSLQLLEIQRLGSRRMPVAEFLRGKPWVEVPGSTPTG